MTARTAKRSASLYDSDDMSPTSPPHLDSGNGTGSSGGNPLAPPRKRKRRVVSCAECHRRKQKCDRNLPCRACIDRKMESSCHYETAAMSRDRHHMRVAEAATYSRALQVGGSLPGKAVGFGYAQSTINTLGFLDKIDGQRSAAAAADAVRGGASAGDILGILALDDSGLEGPSLASMVSEDAIVPPAEISHAAELTEQQFYYHAQRNPKTTANMTRQQHHESQLLIHSQHPSNDHQQQHQRPQTTDPYGTTERYRALVRELPPRAVIDHLVPIYFSDFNWKYYALDEDIFYKQLADFSDVAIGPFATLQSPYELSADLRAFPALLFNVMATALLMLELSNEDDMTLFYDIKHPSNTTNEDLALDYSETGAAILTLLGKRQMSYTSVLASFARAAFLKYVALITEGWHEVGSAIRDAQEVGLHRTSMDPKPWAQTAEAVLENQWEIQRRRRLWMILVSWDIQMGVILGRPISVDPSLRVTIPVDCILPSTIAERSTMLVQPRGEEDPPTPLTRAIWAYQAIAPLRPILELERDGPCPRDFSRVDELHQRLLDIEANTPPYFRLQNPDTRYDDLPGCKWLPSIRATLPQVTIFNFMALHRPYIFTRAKSRTAALKACLRMLEAQRLHFSLLKPQQYKTFSLFFGTFDSLVLMAAIYILFPKENPELLPDTIQHYRWSVDRFEIMKEHYSLAHSALGVLHAIYLRLRKTLGISFLETEHGLSGITSGLGSAPVDALTLSNIDPSLKDDAPVLAAGSKEGSVVGGYGGGSGQEHGASGSVSTNNGLTPGAASSGSGASSAGSDIFSNSIATGGQESPVLETAPVAGGGGVSGPAGGVDQSKSQQQEQQRQQPSESGRTGAAGLVDPQLVPDDFGSRSILEQQDSIFPDDFDWSSLPPICPTGDLAYNVLLGVSDGTTNNTATGAATWGTGSSGAAATVDLWAGGLMSIEGGLGGTRDMSRGNTAAAAATRTAQAETGQAGTADPSVLSKADASGAPRSSPTMAGFGSTSSGAAAATVGMGALLAANSTVDGTLVPWQFEGDFGNNSLWGLLNTYTPF